jgi:3-oxoadipate enol-lactonase
MRMIAANGLRFCTRIDGPPDGRAIVFANSLGTDHRVWDRLLPLLPAGLRILRCDMRGHGLSDAPGGDYWMGDLVADAAGLMDAAKMRDAVFVGLSIGGMVAQGLAAERPDLVSALVLSNTAPKIGTAEIWAERGRMVAEGGIAALADGVLERWFPAGWRAENPDDLALWRHMLLRTPIDGYMGCCAALGETDLRESTARLIQPALVLAGSADGSTPPDLVREMAESMQHARFELIRGAGHIPCVAAPEATARLIADFLRETGAA